MARHSANGDEAMISKPSQSGLTYLVLLWWVAISGVMLSALGASWAFEARREREAEYVFRGEQIVQALQSYRAATPKGMPPLPQTLEELMEDRRGPVLKRHLRRVWPDPMTGQAWGLLTEQGRIQGVYSQLASRSPIGGPKDAKTYRDWVFEPPKN